MYTAMLLCVHQKKQEDDNKIFCYAKIYRDYSMHARVFSGETHLKTFLHSYG